MPDLTIGADPELFVRHKKTNSLVSAHDLIKGTKEKPHQLKTGACQVDGPMAEFNIVPAKNAAAFQQNVLGTRKKLNKMLRSSGDYELMVQATGIFDAEYFKELPDEVKILGCSPDWNAYDMTPARTPEYPDNTWFGAGHIHVGWFDRTEYPNGASHPTNQYIDDGAYFTRHLDGCLYVLSPLWDLDYIRRAAYGPGRFRPKPYGVEYRSLSNEWLQDKNLIKWIFNMTAHAYTQLKEGFNLADEGKNEMHDFICAEHIDFRQLKAYHHMLVNLYGYPPLPLGFLNEERYKRKVDSYGYQSN